ncbi:MAG: alpha-L-arabinofuranosidase C-terminal domain-containing protein [Edaphobacter sp.]|uniref:alpha-L-arabinofuranosidase C-terminal domain-containing protein n=1 Tax=Edaphobacter sp. TaxID=1934404 RepID=UPI00239F99EF|nr:alpha-L-arabinofuranosidase C-terminal domain-containing protein [Edaphobacter sp.]MDE1178056.1 alpha-L-arabinofuranosidase C-terminal domain-containing protein [Edaphobacter sp.]
MPETKHRYRRTRSLRAASWTAGLACAITGTSMAQITSSHPMPHEVEVHVSANGTRTVPETLFGSFLEPIGNSINNGISAEILVNRSLEDGLWNHVNLENMFREQPELIESSNETGIPLPWQSLNTNAGNRFELHIGDAANTWQSLEIMGQPDELTGIKQRVYLPVHRVLTYKVSLYAKHLNGPETLRVSLRSHTSGKVLAEATMKASAKDWTKYTATLELKQGSVRRLEPVDFAVSVEGVERVDVDQISLMPTDAIGTLDPDEVAMAKAMHMTELRFGGNFSSYYHWRDGIGPEDKRLTTKNIAWGIPEYNNFGTDEFLQLCDLTGAIPQFNLNMGSGTPEEAADWVRYIREHHKGHVIYEIGNELYGKWQVGYPTINEIAARTLLFSKAVRSVDPDAEIIATGLGPMADGKWNAQQLTLPAGTFNYLSLHFILGTNHQEMKQPTPDFVAASAYAIPYAGGPYFDKVQAQVDADPKLRGKVHFAITEWLFNSKGFGERNFTNESPSWMNEGGAVMAAGFFNTLLRHTDQVKIADMTGSMEFAGVWKRREQVYAVPAYYAFQIYSDVKGDTLLPVTSDTGTYAVKGGVKPLDDVTDIPYIDVVATRSKDGKTVTLLCVNRSLEQDIPTHFSLDSLHVAGTAVMKQIYSVSRYERNDEIEPKHVLPLEGTAKVAKDGAVSVVLPHDSVTVIRVPVQ